MHKSVITIALQHSLNVGRDHLGHYFIADQTGRKIEMSNYPTAASGIVMVRRFLRHK